MKNEHFGKLVRGIINSIASFEGKTAPNIEDEIGQRVGLSGDAIRRYKSGHIPPELTTIETLAEMGVKRGYFNRDWLVTFLKVVRHPAPEKVIEQLLPTAPRTAKQERVYHNLPAPTYNQFVMRDQAFKEVLEGLTQRSAVVLIASLGGMGKTSLAREIAAGVLQGCEGLPSFDASVWISDKDRPGTTTLSLVLDEIAHTLDYPGFTQLEFAHKRREVEQLLRSQRVLLVVDNFETITDEVLLNWLLRLPEPSKALITTRQYRREFRSSWPVELQGMTETEAGQLITERMRLLHLSPEASADQFDSLITTTGGNPKALTVALGCLKYDHRPLAEVVQDLLDARGELFDDLFSRAWALLEVTSREVLLSMTFFANSVGVGTISAAIDVKGHLLETTIERLTDLALLDVQHVGINQSPRYILHPLVRSFALARLAEQPGFSVQALPRILNWYIEFANSFGDPHSQLSNLEQLDQEQETVYRLLQMAFDQKLYRQVIELAQAYNYHYYVYGYWGKMQDTLHLYEEAARNLNDHESMVWAWTKQVQMLIKQNQLDQVESYLPQLNAYIASTELSVFVLIALLHTLGLYYQEQNQPEQAILYWQQALSYDLTNLPWEQANSRRWLGNTLYQKGDLEAAKTHLVAACQEAIEHNFTRIIVGIQIKLAEIALKQQNPAEAERYLLDSLEQACIHNDHRNIARTRQALSRLHRLKGDLVATEADLTVALDHYERIGMHREWAEVQAALAELVKN